MRPGRRCSTQHGTAFLIHSLTKRIANAFMALNNDAHLVLHLTRFKLAEERAAQQRT